MSQMFRDAPAVLARYGVPPDADAAVLLAALAALAWEARVVFRSCAVDRALRDRADPLWVTVGGRALWELGEAIDGPVTRRERGDPAVVDDGAAAAEGPTAAAPAVLRGVAAPGAQPTLPRMRPISSAS